MSSVEQDSPRQFESRWRVARRRIGAVLLSIACLSSALGLLTVVTTGSALFVLALLILGMSLALYSTKRRLFISIPSLALGVLGIIINIEANTWCPLKTPQPVTPHWYKRMKWVRQ